MYQRSQQEQKAIELHQDVRHIERHFREGASEAGFRNDREVITAIEQAIEKTEALLASVARYGVAQKENA